MLPFNERERLYRMISSKDYELFLQLQEEAEDEHDIQKAEDRLADPQQSRIDFDEFFENVGG